MLSSHTVSDMGVFIVGCYFSNDNWIVKRPFTDINGWDLEITKIIDASNITQHTIEVKTARASVLGLNYSDGKNLRFKFDNKDASHYSIVDWRYWGTWPNPIIITTSTEHLRQFAKNYKKTKRGTTEIGLADLIEHARSFNMTSFMAKTCINLSNLSTVNERNSK